MTQRLLNQISQDPACASLISRGLLRWESGVSLKTLTTFRTGGTAALVLYPCCEEAACALIRVLKNDPPLVLGNGSNVLAPDRGLRRPILLTQKLNDVAVEGTTVRAEAGVSATQFAVRMQKLSLAGAEFLFGIPGTIGGAAVMNAGAYDHAMDEIVQSVTVCDREGNRREISRDEACLSYRHSRFMDTGEVVLSVTFALKNGESETIRRVMDALMERRKAKQPLEYPSAGSYFKRPPGHYAGKLIEDCCLKGLRVGGAMVSCKHAGFVINYDNATTADILALEEQVRQTVLERFGICLECEVQKPEDRP